MQDCTRELEGRKAIVVGSTSGIGRATALELARAGADVIVHGRSRAKAEEVVNTIRALGVRSEVLPADLVYRDQSDRLVEKAWELWGSSGLDAWVHFAGADTLTGVTAKLDFNAKLDLLWRTDVEACVRLCRNVGLLMKQRGSGVILTMGWDQAETGMEGDSGQLFALAKGAVAAFTKSLAVSLAPEVRVNAVAPGWIRTAWGESASKVWQDRVLRETPLGRWGTPEDVAKVARFLVGPAAEFINGQIIRVNGGSVRG